MNKEYTLASRYLSVIREIRKQFWYTQTNKTPATVELMEQMQDKLDEMERLCLDCIAKSFSDFKQ